MKITSLVENTCSTGLPVEHGLSLYIETEEHTILFDMGQSDLFVRNAEELGVDLGRADLAVLSHGHYDHGGGLAKFLEINRSAPVYLSRHAFEPHYNGTEKYIGLDSSLLDSSFAENERLIFTDKAIEIGKEITLYPVSETGRYPMQYDMGTGGLNMVSDGKIVPEDFRHEQYMVIEENGKRILFSGCSHKGILNIVSWFEPDVLIGGFHFSKLEPDDRLKEYAEILDSHDTEYYTCHCTGVRQFEFMKSYMKKLNYMAEGEVVII